MASEHSLPLLPRTGASAKTACIRKITINFRIHQIELQKIMKIFGGIIGILYFCQTQPL